MFLGLTYADLISKLWENTIQKNGCWLYQVTSSKNYGIYKTYRVHRISAHIFLGMDFNAVEDEKFSLHRLECKHKNCWNPDHLYVGDYKDNNRDISLLIIKCPKGHPYDEQNTYFRPDGKGRECKACVRIRANNFRKAKLRKLSPINGNTLKPWKENY